MSPGHIFLIGFMGAGKSTVACLVADSLAMPCADLDDVIESRSGSMVSELFAETGEEGFRALETDVLASLEGSTPTVIACGGGIVTRPENRAALKRMGTVVLLEVSAEEAIARVGDATTRPLLSGPSGALAATSLLKAREALYRSVSDTVVDTEGRTPEQVAALIVSALGETS